MSETAIQKLNSSSIPPISQNGAWVLQLSDGHRSNAWRQIKTDNGLSPPARGLSAIEAMDPFDLDGSIVENPVVMFGGADWSCFSSGCKV